MAVLVPQTTTRASIVEAAAAALDAANTCPNAGRMFLVITETGAAAATVDIPVASGQCSDSDVSLAFTGSETYYVGPFPVATYGETLTINETAGAAEANAIIVGV